MQVETRLASRKGERGIGRTRADLSASRRPYVHAVAGVIDDDEVVANVALLASSRKGRAIGSSRSGIDVEVTRQRQGVLGSAGSGQAIGNHTDRGLGLKCRTTGTHQVTLSWQDNSPLVSELVIDSPCNGFLQSAGLAGRFRLGVIEVVSNLNYVMGFKVVSVLRATFDHFPGHH